MRQEKKEKVVVIESDRGENCETLNFIRGIEIVTGEKERRINSVNPVESSRNKIKKVTDDEKDDASNSESRVVTVEKETRANSLIPVASSERVVTCGDHFNDSECDRSPIKKVISDEKEDTLKSESHAQEKINSSDVDSLDDENLLLSRLKMISCQKQDKVRQVENPLNLVCYPDSTSEETKSNGEHDKTNIDQIIERLQDTEDRESPPMSMEEYRLTYTKEIFETAIDDEQTIIKETRNLVDSDIYSQSDTTATRGMSDCGNDSSDSEPEIVIYRNKNNSKIKPKNLIDHGEANYLVSGEKFGFPLRKILTDELKEKCLKQDWCAIEIKSGLKEGRGVFAKKCIKKIPRCVIMEGSKCHEVMQRNIFFLMMRSAIIW